MHNKVFEIYKSNNNYILKNSKPDNIYFQLSFEANRAFIRVIDERNNDVFPDKYLYSDETFNILNELEYIIEKEKFNISWLKKTDNKNLIYLDPSNTMIYQESENYKE